MIQIENINVSYQQTLALDNITLNLDGPSITGIIGPNGAGKSTLIKALIGIIPHSGQFLFNKQPIRQQLNRLSYVAPRLSLVWQIALVTFLSFFYGVLLDYGYGLLFKSGITFVISGLLYDTYHAVSTLLFYPFIQSIFRRFLK